MDSNTTNVSRILSMIALTLFLIVVIFVAVVYFSSGNFRLSTLLIGVVVSGLIYVIGSFASRK